LVFGCAALVAGGSFTTGVHAKGPNAQALCIGHHPQDFVWYTASCTGHDEPEIDPLSNAPGSAQDLTWTVVLPTGGAVQVDAVGPTFWIGGTVSDPNSLFAQAFLELQFYPNSITTGCTAGGGYNVTFSGARQRQHGLLQRHALRRSDLPPRAGDQLQYKPGDGGRGVGVLRRLASAKW
jgi:hypothetical protein